MTDTTNALPPCPFCGKAAKAWKQGIIRQERVACSDGDCGASCTHFSPTEWNTRTQQPPAVAVDLDEELEKVANELAMLAYNSEKVSDQQFFAKLSGSIRVAALRLAAPVEVAKPPLGKPPEWVSCPICRESDMRKDTDGLIHCVNHNCGSNGGKIFCPEWQQPATPPLSGSPEDVHPGDDWLQKQFDSVKEIVSQWPDWMKRDLLSAAGGK